MRPEAADTLIEGLRWVRDRIPGIQQIHVTRAPEDESFPTTLTFSTSAGQQTYIAEFRAKLSNATFLISVAPLFESETQSPTHPYLLVADYLTKHMTETLVSKGIQFIDTAGNIHLNFRNFYILVEGRTPAVKVPTEAFTHNGLRVVYGLLVIPDLETLNYRDISHFTGVSLATVSRTINSLIQQEYVIKADTGGVRVPDFLRLLRRWEFGYLETLRARIGPTTWFIPHSDYNENLELFKNWRNIFVGGDEAASLLLGSERSQSLTVYADPEMHEKLDLQLGFIDSKDMPWAETPDLYLFEKLTIFDWYMEVENEFPVSLANPVLIRAELLALGGEQRRETANRLLHELILPTFQGRRS